MAKLTFLGTCSGTEPFENMNHTSFIIEQNERIYWFDAGENCSRSAFLAGKDMLSIESIFISHPHSDHIGGLLGLIILIRQQIWRRSQELKDGKVRLFSPCKGLWDNMKPLIDVADKNLFDVMNVEHSLINDGLIFENDDIKVSAVHNEHMKIPEDGEWKSYSFLIEIDGKRVIYSGDIKRLSELDCFIDGGCDMLICESGHHKVSDILAYAESKGIKRLYFNHHGREIINNREDMEKLAAEYPHSAIIAHDGLAIEI